jgi:hypothetical protein
MLSDINDSFGDVVTARVPAGQWMVLTVAVPWFSWKRMEQ